MTRPSRSTLGRWLLALAALAPLAFPQTALGSSIYWTDASETQGSAGLYRSPTTIAAPQFLVPSSSSTGVAYDSVNHKIYFTQRIGDEKILRSNLDGSGVETVIDNSADMRGIAVDPFGGKLYWTEGTTRIKRANLDGSGVETLVDGLPGAVVWDLAVDPAGGKLYWTTLDRGTIRRANLDGTGAEDIVTGIGRPFGLTLDLAAGLVFWTATDDDKIQRSNLDGSGVADVVVATGAGSGLRDVAVDPEAGLIYWADSHIDAIRRANLDGTLAETFIPGLSAPWGLVLVPEPSTLLLMGFGLTLLATTRASRRNA